MQKRSQQKAQRRANSDVRTNTIVYSWSYPDSTCGHLWATFQVESCCRTKIKEVVAKLGGTRSGVGVDPTHGRQIILIRRKFKNKKALLDFHKGLDFDVERI